LDQILHGVFTNPSSLKHMGSVILFDTEKRSQSGQVSIDMYIFPLCV